MQKVAFPPGHFYNPIPSDEDIQQFISSRKFNVELPGIDLNLAGQRKNYDLIMKYRDEFVWKKEVVPGLAYHGDNDQFSLCCAYPLYGFMRLLQPKRIIEIGSGYSTALMSDVNNLYLNGSVSITCIEPYPDRLVETWGEHIADHVTLHREFLQNTDLAIFDQLEENDFCFIDSSHVAKLNSDVNRELFEVLPRLKKGVIIHVHDIPYPFEYWNDWLLENRAWNEAYMLRAFLHNNRDYEIIFWGTCLTQLDNSIPDPDLGGSIWMRKIR